MFGELTKLRLGGTIVDCLAEIGGPESSIAEVERTKLGSTHKSYRPSKIAEAGTISFKLYYDPSIGTHTTIRGYADESEIVAWAIEYSDGTTHAFNGFVTSANITGGEQETEIMLEVELRIDGKVTETVGVSSGSGGSGDA